MPKCARLFIFLLMFFLYGCSSDNIGMKAPEDWRARAKELDIMAVPAHQDEYLMTDLYFRLYSFYDIDVREAKSVFTKIEWMIPELGITYELYNRDMEQPDRARIIERWSQGFHKPGVYNSTILGYRGEEIIFLSECKFRILPSFYDEFIYSEWNDIPYNRNTLVYNNANKQDSPFFYFTKSNIAQTDVVEMHYTSYDAILHPYKFDAFIADSHDDTLLDALIYAYGAPTKSHNRPDDNIEEAYNNLFPTSTNHPPIFMWESSHLYIALVKSAHTTQLGQSVDRCYVRAVLKGGK